MDKTPSAGKERPAKEQDQQTPVAGKNQEGSAAGKNQAAAATREEKTPAPNVTENQVVHTRSVSIKGVLKGQPRKIPVANDEINEDDQVDKAIPPEPEKIEVTEEMIRKAWKDYAASIEKSHPRIFSTMSQQVPRLNEKGIIQINLNTQAQRENFIHRIKPALTRYFQRTIANIEFVFETQLIDNETTVKKVYTDQDKLDFLIRKNPDLEKMKSKFNLDFDN